MNVIDSSGWLEYFADGANAAAFAALIERPAEVLVPSVVLFEVGRRVWQQRGEAAAEEAMAALMNLQLVPVDGEVARLAVGLGARHKLAMADSLIYATAQRHEATLWSQDRDFENVPGVHYLPKQAT